MTLQDQLLADFGETLLDPDGPEGGKEEWSLDLSGFGSGTSALFIAALFASWGRVSSYTGGKTGALPQ